MLEQDSVLFQGYSYLGWETDTFSIACCGMCFSGDKPRKAWQSIGGTPDPPPQPGESYQTLEKPEGTAGANKELQDGKEWSGGRKGKMNLREGSDNDGPLPHPFLLIIELHELLPEFNRKLLEYSKHGSNWTWSSPTPPPSSLAFLLPQ